MVGSKGVHWAWESPVAGSFGAVDEELSDDNHQGPASLPSLFCLCAMS